MTKPSLRRYELRALTVLLVLLIAIPSRLIFTPLGNAGTPAEIFGLVLLLWWGVKRLTAERPPQRVPRPVHFAIAVFLLSVLASYVAASTRPINTLEVSAADRGILSALSWAGMLLIAGEGPRDVDELNRLLRRLCLGGGLLATLGIVQFVTGDPLTNYVQIPGLSDNVDLGSVISRNGFSRPAGTTIHPIEFGAVLTAILPIALHYAVHDTNRRRLARWFPVAAIAIAVPISISRSAILSAAIVLLVLLPTWEPPLRRRAYAIIVLIGALLYLSTPGLLRTIANLFTGISEDSSAQSRTDSYALAFRLIDRSPIFGRGFRTFLPSYRILDNQYLGTAIEMGIVGVVSVLFLFGTGVAVAIASRRASTDAQFRGLAQALAASIASTGCSFALFDALSFPMAASLIFIVLGMIAAANRIVRAPLLAAGKQVAQAPT